MDQLAADAAQWARNRDLLVRASRVMPGGSLGIYYMPDAAASLIDYGRGSRLFDSLGREYIDFVLGSGAMILGHAHPATVRAVADQAAKGSHFYHLTEPALLMAETMVQAIPCAAQLKYASSGGEATYYALRIARAVTGRDKVLRFDGGFHGFHDHGLSSRSAGIPTAARDLELIAPFNDLDATLEILNRGKRDIAAVIVEPLQRITSPRPRFLQELRRVTTELGIVLIFDEIVTGFRLAWGGSQEKYGVVPDLATYGKLIGGGYPLAAVAGPAEMMGLVNPRHQRGDYVYMSGTLNGNPISATAGLATLRELQKAGSYERLNSLGDHLRTGLRRIAKSLNRTVRVLGDGPLAALAFTDADPYDPSAVRHSDREALYRLEVELIRRGLFVNISGPSGKLYISAAHTETDLDAALEAFEDAFVAIQQ